MPTIDEEFEREFELFVKAGGFSRPCLNEGYEIMLRLPRDGEQLERCKHGLTFLTCSLCYLQLQK